MGPCYFSLKNCYVTCPCLLNTKDYNFEANNNGEKIAKPSSNLVLSQLKIDLGYVLPRNI